MDKFDLELLAAFRPESDGEIEARVYAATERKLAAMSFYQRQQAMEVYNERPETVEESTASR